MTLALEMRHLSDAGHKATQARLRDVHADVIATKWRTILDRIRDAASRGYTGIEHVDGYDSSNVIMPALRKIASEHGFMTDSHRGELYGDLDQLLVTWEDPHEEPRFENPPVRYNRKGAPFVHVSVFDLRNRDNNPMQPMVVRIDMIAGVAPPQDYGGIVSDSVIARELMVVGNQGHAVYLLSTEEAARIESLLKERGLL